MTDAATGEPAAQGTPPATPATPAADPPAPSGDPATPPAGDGPYRPEGLTDGFYGENDRETIDKLAKAYNERRAQDNERGKVPKSAEDYTLPETLPEGMSPDVQQFLGELNDDPVYQTIRGAFHEAGVTDKQFSQVVPAVFQQLLEGELMEPMVDPVAERKMLVPDALANASVEDQGKAVDTRLNENRGWLRSLGGDGEGGLDKDAIAAAESALLDTAAGNRALEHFRSLQGGSTNPAVGGQGAGGVTAADLQKMAADPRADPNSPKYDKGYAAELDAHYKAVHGS